MTVRRTRNNIENDPDYLADINKQGISFPKILPPNELTYIMDADTSRRFYETLKQLTEKIHFARYRAIEFLKPQFRSKYKNAEHIGQSLAGIYRVHTVKRLESSFYAFKKSLATLLRITNDMIKMFEEDKVIIAPDLKVKELQVKGMELDEIIEHAITKGYLKEDILYPADAFEPIFLTMLQHDKKILEHLNDEWAQEHDDPKYDLFSKKLNEEFFNTNINHSGKLVLFSESVDTLNYLYDRLTNEMQRSDVLMVSATNRSKLTPDIRENFDANEAIDQKRYNIIITTDVLAEGVNLHRSNVIINYDSPWNATRLMQRIGRVNRIGSKAKHIYNYMFYPSRQGDNEIQLYKNALLKLQGFHSAFGEDAQIYSKEEIVRQFKMYDNTVKDNIDKKIALLREVRELYNTNRKLYHKIKNLPMKTRLCRDASTTPMKYKQEVVDTSQQTQASTTKSVDCCPLSVDPKTIVFISSDVKTEFYLADDKGVQAIDFLEAVSYLKATPQEKAIPFDKNTSHYNHVNKALELYTKEYVEAADTTSANRNDLDKSSLEANKFLRTIMQITTDDELRKHCTTLITYINEGIYSQLPRHLKTLSREYKNDRLKIKQDEYTLLRKIETLIKEYHTYNKQQQTNHTTDPQIIISETFIMTTDNSQQSTEIKY